MAFEQNKYKGIFEQRYGKGSYDAGLSSARSIGATKGQADSAKDEYNQRLKEYKEKMEKKTYADALDYWNDPTNNSALKKQGANRTAEDIRNDPMLQMQIKEQGYSVDDYIDAMYNASSSGQFRSEREFKGFAEGLKGEADKKPKTTEDYLTQYSKSIPATPEKKEKKKGDLGILKKMGNFMSSKDVDGDGERDGLLGAIDRFVAPISHGATEFVARGNAERMATNAPDNPVVKATQKDRGLETKILNAAGMMAAAVAPYGQGYKAADFLLNKAPGFAKIANPYAKKAITGGVAGGLAESGISGVNELVNSEAYDMKDHAIRAGIGVAGGAILDPVLHGIYNLIKGAKGAKNVRQAPQPSETLALPAPKESTPVNSEVLGLPEPQLRLPETNKVAPTLDNFRNAFKQPNGLTNPIPEMPDIMRIAANRNKFEQAGVNFAQNTKNAPKARMDTTPIETPVDPLNRGQAYWQQRYEDFAKQVNARHDLNEMTPEALEDLWSSFAKYDEPVKLEQVFDLAYPKGFEAPPVPKAEPISEPPARTIKDDLKEDPRINELVKKLFPPAGPRPKISRPATLEEMFQNLREIAPQKKSEPSLDNLRFSRPQDSLVKQFKQVLNQSSAVNPKGWSKNDFKNTPVMNGSVGSLDRLKQALNPNKEVAAASEAITPASLERLKNVSSGPSLTRLSPEKNNSAVNGFDLLRSLNPKNTNNLADSFRSKVDRNPKGTNKLKDIFSNLRTQFVDDLAPLESLEKGVRGSISSADDSLYKQGRLFRGSSEKANQIVETELSPILKNIKNAGYTADDLGDYALAVHAKDVNAKGIKSGFSNEEVNAVINKFKNPVMEQARKDLTKLNNDLLNDLANAGVIAKETVQQLQKKHPNYMPLFRSFDDDKIEFTSGLSKAFSMGSSPLKKLEGSDRNVIDPLESVVQNIFKLTNAADRNKVAGQLGKLAVEDTESLFIRQISPGEEVGRKNVVSALENGQKVQYEVPSEVYKAMMNLDKESSNFLIKILQKPAGTLRAGATLTPEFSLRNPMKDVPQAFIVSNSGFNPLVDFPVGLFQSAMKGRSIKIAGKEFKTPDKMYRQFIEDNGGLGNIVSVDRNMHKQAIEEALKGKNKRFINVVNPKAWLGVLRAIADVSESATKVGEYRAALRSGASRQEAAYRARDIMDFARAGVSVREANKVVAFLNANIQGKSKLLRAVKENPLKVTMKSLEAITMPTVGVFLAQKYLASDEQKQLINDAPSWLKNTFWLIPVPGTEQVARIPKPYDLAPIFANLPERSLEYLANNDPAAFDNFARESFSSYAIPTMLTGLAPIIEGMANYSFFRDSPIIPKRESNLNYPEQYDVNTSETAKALGKGIDKLTRGAGTFKNFGSPRVVDNTIRGFTGGLGTYATDIIDLIVEGSGMVDEVERPEKDFLTEQTPLKAFLMNKNSTGKSVDKLYGLKDKLNRDRGSYQSKNEKFPNEAEYQFVNDVTKEISEISKAIRMVENDPNMDGEQKRQEIDKLNKLRNYLAYEVRKKMEAQK